MSQLALDQIKVHDYEGHGQLNHQDHLRQLTTMYIAAPEPS